jgi:hypothetical protein
MGTGVKSGRSLAVSGTLVARSVEYRYSDYIFSVLVLVRSAGIDMGVVAKYNAAGS